MESLHTASELPWSAIIPELIKGIPAAFVALVIGVIAAGVAWRQYKVARGKLNLDLFEQRYAIYEIVWKYISDCTDRPADQRTDSYQAFSNSIPKAYFLFGEEVGDWMTKIKYDSGAMAYAHRTLATAAQYSDSWTTAVADTTRLENQFRDDLDSLRERFALYMDFKEWQGANRIARAIHWCKTTWLHGLFAH